MATQQQAEAAGAQRPLQDTLAQIVRRLRLARWLRLAARGTLVATCFALLCVGLAHWELLPSWLPLEFIIPLLMILGVGLGTLFAAARPVDASSAARAVEVRLDLKERLSSALEFERNGLMTADPEAALLRRLQREDAADHARALHPADAVPLRPGWEAKALIPASLLLLLALVLPALPIFVPPGVRAERMVVQESGAELARSARVVEKRADAQDLPATKAAARDLQRLGQRMAQGRMDKKQAMVQMARLGAQMADRQKRLTQTGDGPGAADKDLTQAGRQLAQSLQQPTPSAGGKTSGRSGTASGPSANPQGNRTSPGMGSPELQRAAQALARGDVHGLGQQLRALAQRIATHPQSPGDQQRTARDLQKLSEALKDTPLSEAQKHVPPAADAMTHGDSQRAADELRRAADAADRQAKQQQDAQGVQNARQSLQDSEQQMAQASKPADVPSGDPGQSGAPTPSATPGGQTQGRPGSGGRQTGQDRGGQGRSQVGHGKTTGGGKGTAQGNSGASQNAGQSGGGSRQGGMPGGAGRSGGGRPGGGGDSPGAGHAGAAYGAPHRLDAQFNPTQNPKYGKIYLGAGSGTGGGGKLLSAKPGTQAPPGAAPASSVPYSSTLAPARKGAETAMDREDIPPAYRSGVRRYFDSLQPAAGKAAK